MSALSEPDRFFLPQHGRRGFLKHGLGAATAAIASPAIAGLADYTRALGPVVETAYGRIRGFESGGIHAFRGVPYGASTGANRRFLAPLPPTPWPDVLDTFGWGPSAPQGKSTEDRAYTAGNVYALAEPDVGLQTLESEDCLTLNVWTPSVRDYGKRPVMLWLHGGGFVVGSASTAVHDGERLSRYGDVVIVSCNHRLHGFGYTCIDHPDYRTSGNAGMLDILLALRWIRENISNFGGDPGNVTIFGYSGGGQKVSVLLAMPEAKGLFHKAIIQSGQTPRLLDVAQALDVTDRLAAALGISSKDPAEFLKPSTNALLKACRIVMDAPPREPWGFPARFSPVADGRVVAGQPLDPNVLALSADVPVMIGSTKQEMAAVQLSWNPNAADIDMAQLAREVRDYMGDKTEAAINGYHDLYPSLSPWALFSIMTADVPTRVRSIGIAERRHAIGRAPVFMYRIDWQTRVFGGQMGAPHGLEVPLVFRNVREAAGINGGGADAFALSERLSSAWIAFARHGNPGTRSLPWPAYDTARRATMLFDRTCRVADDPDADARKLATGLGLGIADR